MKLSHYQAAGFYPISLVAPDAIVEIPVLTAITIEKGDYLIASGGYATQTATDSSAAFLGIAAEDCDNSAGASGAKSVKVIRAAACGNIRFSVPVGNSALITRAAVGTLCDLHTNALLDIADTTIGTGTVAFWVEDYDASTEAQDGAAYGYAIGSFRIGAP